MTENELTDALRKKKGTPRIPDDGPRICGFCAYWLRDSYDLGLCRKIGWAGQRIVTTKSSQFCRDFEERK